METYAILLCEGSSANIETWKGVTVLGVEDGYTLVLSTPQDIQSYASNLTSCVPKFERYTLALRPDVNITTLGGIKVIRYNKNADDYTVEASEEVFMMHKASIIGYSLASQATVKPQTDATKKV